MSRNKSPKKIPEFEFLFNNISFCNDKTFEPFLETFVQEPENISQKNLGTIFGIFEVADNSEDSSYITNYLISIIKKEYFSKPKRGAIESFEAALHRANLALAKLAEHGNVAWLGKISILCAVLEKYNLHFTRIGACHAFLFREKNLIDISENLSSPENALNPLKTFTDVSSGKIEEGDRIILSLDNIFNIFSFEEIKKSANKFAGNDFVRFLKTALVNELEKAAALIIDIEKKEEKTPEPSPENYQESFNAFSSSSFVKTLPSKDPLEEKLKDEIKEELVKSSKEIENVKHGHIYIKESENLPQETPGILENIYNYFNEGFKNSKKKTRENFSNLFSRAKTIRLRPRLPKIDFRRDKLKNFYLKAGTFLRKIFLFFSDFFAKSVRLIKNFTVRISPQKKSTEERQTDFAIFLENQAKQTTAFSQDIPESPKKQLLFLPSFSKIKEIFSKFSYEQKIYASIILFLIFVVPYIGVKIEKRIAEKKAAEILQNTPKIITPLEQDKNVTRLSSLNSVNQEISNLSEIINLNGNMFFVGNTEVFDLEKNQSFPFPAEITNVQNSVGMDDLNLILLLTKNKEVFSFSPTSKKFQPNLIEIPAEAEISAIGTYLTYIYLLDSPANQIYRYPRAEGGFGAKTDWLKDSLDLSHISNMSITENIFAASQDKLIKLFKGKQQDFLIEETATPIAFSKVYVAKNSLEIYILDKANSRIVRLNQDGNILNQYYNEKIKDASAFSVNEESNVIYFAAENTIYSFNIDQ